MSQRRVVITGLGQVSPVGNDVQTAWNNLLSGKSGIGLITRFNASDINSQIAGEVRDFDIGQYISGKEARRMDVFIHYGIAAALQAISDSGLDDAENLDKDRVGVNIGSGIGGLPSIEATGKTVLEGGARRINPFFIPGSLINLISGHVTILKGYRGPSYGMVSACTTGAHSIGDSARLIKYGDADVMIAGGAEGAISTLGVGGFAAMKALSTRNDDPEHASRPFSKSRDGFVMGEGAGCLVLEELEHAKARGAKIYAEMVGEGASADAHHITASHPEGLGAKLVMQNAMEDAGLKPEDIDYINVHGTSTPVGDISEAKAIKELFGDAAYKLNISSTKSMTGHLLGAAGAVEAMATVLAVQNDIIPPTINHDDDDVDENIDYNLNFTFNKAQKREVRAALSNTFGFGGHNACVIFKKYAE